MTLGPTSGQSSPHGQSSAQYVLGVNAAELDRLGLQHRLWSDAAHALWRRAGVQPGWKVLDIGCGPGFAALDLAQIVGASSPGVGRGGVVGMDESQPYLDYLAAQVRARGIKNISCVRGNATRLAELSEVGTGSFDAAYSRWVMCFVNDPSGVARGVHRALKPGGRWIVQDYFNYEAMATAPRSAAFARAVAATGQSWRARGGDPDIMGRLPAMLEQMGFAVEHLNVQQRIARPGEPMWHWPQTFWTNFLPVLEEMGLLSAAEVAAWVREWNELARTAGAWVLLPPVIDMVAVKR